MAFQQTSKLQFLLLLIVIASVSSYIPTHFMPSPCSGGKKLNIGVGYLYTGERSSGILKFDKAGTNFNCSVILEPEDKLSAITISVRTLDLGWPATITINDSDIKIELKSGSSYYKGDSVFTSKRRGMPVNVTFTSSNFYLHRFQLVYTAFRSGSDCRVYWQYECNNDRCISPELVCDGYNHCGDFSDQNNCGSSPGAVAGYVFGSLFLTVAVVCLVCAVIRKKRQTVTSQVIRPPPRSMVNPTVYPASYQHSSLASHQQSPSTSYQHFPPTSPQQHPAVHYPDAPPSYFATEVGRENPIYH